ncbi:hypothetical protein VU08_01905 [Desulfobulbus sp. F5]|nr:hypothetical protein [Desulfobulbus sp. F5]
MLSRRLQEIKEKIESKVSVLRTESEKELLVELTRLDQYLSSKRQTYEFMESVRKSLPDAYAVTSGPGTTCPCCGK